MREALDALESLDGQQRERALRWLADALDVSTAVTPEGLGGDGAALGDDVVPTPRRFLADKKPTSAVERVACLAYFLTHHRDTREFKTKELTELNTEAAGHKFANAARDVDNADRQNGFLVSAGARQKQLTVRGEALVVALPNREAVTQALDEHPFKRKNSAGGKKAAPAKSAANGSTKNPSSNTKKQSFTQIKSLDFYSPSPTLAEFMDDKAPSNLKDKCVASTYWLIEVAAEDPVTVDHIYTCFKDRGWPLPADLPNTLQQAGSAGFLDTRDREAIKMTTKGENQVEHVLPTTTAK